MNCKTYLIAILVWITSPIMANPLSDLKYNYPHKLAVGINLSGITLDTHYSKLHVKGTDYCDGLNIKYEYYSPESFYFVIAMEDASNNNHIPTHYEGISIRQNIYELDFFDFCIGYTKLYKNWLITPYAGIGSWRMQPFHAHIHANKGFTETMAFNSYGLKCDYSICPHISAGLNVKVTRSYNAKKEFKNKDIHFDSYWESPGIYVSVPGTYYIGKWEARIEPYFAKLSFGDTQLLYGASFNYGYNF